jgi:hypothetical protein
MGLLFGWLLGRGDYDWDAAPHGWGWLWAILPIVLLIVFWIYLRRQMKKGTS